MKQVLNTKLLMTTSALFMGLLGAGASFLPQEILIYFDAPPEEIVVIFVNILGALYLGFAILNWMARGNVIGGIYSRPVALGNFMHFGVVAILLVKQLIAASATIELAIGAVAYSVFAVSFGYVTFAGGPSRG